jgi:hypothetical protein
VRLKCRVLPRAVVSQAEPKRAAGMFTAFFANFVATVTSRFKGVFFDVHEALDLRRTRAQIIVGEKTRAARVSNRAYTGSTTPGSLLVTA